MERKDTNRQVHVVLILFSIPDLTVLTHPSLRFILWPQKKEEYYGLNIVAQHETSPRKKMKRTTQKRNPDNNSRPTLQTFVPLFTLLFLGLLLKEWP